MRSSLQWHPKKKKKERREDYHPKVEGQKIKIGRCRREKYKHSTGPAPENVTGLRDSRIFFFFFFFSLDGQTHFQLCATSRLQRQWRKKKEETLRKNCSFK
ncbi:Uncharacterized protein APZ42_019561 [Daphnia magna]|uniref:Uncharacterized protein n=1 Tax=Daphnia magna TaxID=35525 RepID=A0A162CNM1_9CRUS|nr:Uncharacterized protein APZ42_019561 [Daphnia magna]